MAVQRKRNTSGFVKPLEEPQVIKETVEDSVEEITSEAEPLIEAEPEPVSVPIPVTSMVPVDMPQTAPVVEEKTTIQPSAPVIKTEPRRRNIPRFTK